MKYLHYLRLFFECVGIGCMYQALRMLFVSNYATVQFDYSYSMLGLVFVFALVGALIRILIIFTSRSISKLIPHWRS